MIRQKVLVLWLADSALDSSVVAWSQWDGAGERRHIAGDEDRAPYDVTTPRANDDLASILLEPQPWYEADTGRLELINRIRFWRYVSGDDRFDADYWLSRLENQPGRRVETAS